MRREVCGDAIYGRLLVRFWRVPDAAFLGRRDWWDCLAGTGAFAATAWTHRRPWKQCPPHPRGTTGAWRNRHRRIPHSARRDRRDDAMTARPIAGRSAILPPSSPNAIGVRELRT